MPSQTKPPPEGRAQTAKSAYALNSNDAATVHPTKRKSQPMIRLVERETTTAPTPRKLTQNGIQLAVPFQYPPKESRAIALDRARAPAIAAAQARVLYPAVAIRERVTTLTPSTTIRL